jgi:hypothetical protein
MDAFGGSASGLAGPEAFVKSRSLIQSTLAPDALITLARFTNPLSGRTAVARGSLDRHQAVARHAGLHVRGLHDIRNPRVRQIEPRQPQGRHTASVSDEFRPPITISGRRLAANTQVFDN